MASLNKLFGDDAQPVRREGLFRETTGANGAPIIEALDATAVTLSREGSIDNGHLVGFLHCGHPATNGVGGECKEPIGDLGQPCGNLSCPACYSTSRCLRCFKGLCLEHKHEIPAEADQVGQRPAKIVVCQRCKDEIEKKRNVRKLLRAALSPFVRFQD